MKQSQEAYKVKQYVNDKVLKILNNIVSREKHQESNKLFSPAYIKATNILEKVNRQKAISYNEIAELNEEYVDEEEETTFRPTG